MWVMVYHGFFRAIKLEESAGSTGATNHNPTICQDSITAKDADPRNRVIRDWSGSICDSVTSLVIMHDKVCMVGLSKMIGAAFGRKGVPG